MRLALASLIVVSACTGDGGDGGFGDDDDLPTDGGSHDGLDAFQGPWMARNCDEGKTFTIVVDGDTSLWTTSYYDVASDTQCASPYARREVTVALYVRGPATTPDDATELDMITDGVQLTPLTQADADGWNAQFYCGYNDWTANQPKEVAGGNCNGPVAFRGYIQHQITKVENGRWYHGDPASGAGTTDASRPTAWMPGAYQRP